MGDRIDELKEIPMSDLDIFNRLKGRTNIVEYRNLKKVKDIDELLKDDSAVILYEKARKNGHWVCLIRYLLQWWTKMLA